MIEWFVALLFGTGATLATNPAGLPAGEVFLLAREPLKPVSDGMRVTVGVGTATSDAKSTILSRSLDAGEYGDVRVAVCRSERDCLALTNAGTFFSEKSFGFAFSGSGPAYRGGQFIGVKIMSSKALPSAVVSWSNFIQ